MQPAHPVSRLFMNNHNECPAPDVLAAFASGELSNAALAPMQAHVSHCDACLETVGFLTSKSSESDAGEIQHATFAQVDQQIGPYRLIRRIGEGGMGEVWEAQQLAPVRRIVALKLLKAGMDTRQIVTRFEAERQMLALMQHPSIAQVFDAGITDAGRPYFVMEYVDGLRITTYCDVHNLGVAERLELFRQVCEAVQHAHQKGVIHRDLKPSNVLIATQAEKPIPKVIDFGLAKATTSELENASLTEVGTLLGTPAYASPEQMGFGAQDIDTRTDVYSLGVLLYELLIGVIPYELIKRGDLGKAGAAAILDLRQTVRDIDPARPSVRFNSLGDLATEIAKARGTQVKLLRNQLRGDLDWVVMKALEKDRERRYHSPHELALDIDRYLKHEPLQAGPPTTAYRVGKFVRRHRIGTAFAAALAALVIAFVVVTIVQAQRVAKERDRATAEAAKANSINKFLQETLGSADPWQTGKDVSIREVLANAAKKADTEFKDQPLVAAAVKNTIGKTYVGLGQMDEGEKLIREALEARRSLHRVAHEDVAESLFDLAYALSNRGSYSQSVKYSREAFEMRRQLFGEFHEVTTASLAQYAEQLLLNSDYDAALAAATSALATLERLYGADSEKLVDTLTTIGHTHLAGSGTFPDAEVAFVRALRISERAHGKESLQSARETNNLGAVYYQWQRFDQALEMYRASARIQRQVLGNDHPNALLALENLGASLMQQGKYNETLALLREVLAGRSAALGSDSPLAIRTLVNIAIVQSKAGQLELAAASFDEALPRFAKAYGAEHEEYAVVLVNFAKVLRKQGRDPDAEPILRQALAIHVTRLGADHPGLATTRFELGSLLADRGAYEEAESLLLAAHSTRAKVFGSDHATTKVAADALSKLYQHSGRKRPVGVVK